MALALGAGPCSCGADDALLGLAGQIACAQMCRSTSPNVPGAAVEPQGLGGLAERDESGMLLPGVDDGERIVQPRALIVAPAQPRVATPNTKAGDTNVSDVARLRKIATALLVQARTYTNQALEAGNQDMIATTDITGEMSMDVKIKDWLNFFYAIFFMLVMLLFSYATWDYCAQDDARMDAMENELKLQRRVMRERSKEVRIRESGGLNDPLASIPREYHRNFKPSCAGIGSAAGQQTDDEVLEEVCAVSYTYNTRDGKFYHCTPAGGFSGECKTDTLEWTPPESNGEPADSGEESKKGSKGDFVSRNLKSADNFVHAYSKDVARDADRLFDVTTGTKGHVNKQQLQMNEAEAYEKYKEEVDSTMTVDPVLQVPAAMVPSNVTQSIVTLLELSSKVAIFKGGGDDEDIAKDSAPSGDPDSPGNFWCSNAGGMTYVHTFLTIMTLHRAASVAYYILLLFVPGPNGTTG